MIKELIKRNDFDRAARVVSAVVLPLQRAGHYRQLFDIGALKDVYDLGGQSGCSKLFLRSFRRVLARTTVGILKFWGR